MMTDGKDDSWSYTLAELDAAVAAERERCAKLCDEVASNPSIGDDGDQDGAALCARMIRGEVPRDEKPYWSD